MVRAHETGFNTDDCRMLLQVHDSIVWEVRQELVEEYKPAISHMMSAVEPDFGVHFKVDVHNWNEVAA
jgi:DNA polymerase I-like protein with 3'-5' exonuclease and polymerase domains